MVLPRPGSTRWPSSRYAISHTFHAHATKKDAVCDKCSDERKDKPLVGLTILRDVAKDTEDQTLWSGGNILDPNNGKVYKVRLRPIDGGKRLEVRGYVGMPMLGRTQTWVRVE